jgi:hypothetical protein
VPQSTANSLGPLGRGDDAARTQPLAAFVVSHDCPGTNHVGDPVVARHPRGRPICEGPLLFRKPSKNEGSETQQRRCLLSRKIHVPNTLIFGTLFNLARAASSMAGASRASSSRSRRTAASDARAGLSASALQRRAAIALTSGRGRGTAPRAETPQEATRWRWRRISA